MTKQNTGPLGIDIGSVSIALALMDADGRIQKTLYRFHHGHIQRTLAAMLDELGVKTVRGVAVTKGTPSVVRSDRVFDDQVAAMAAAGRIHGRVGTLLIVGGERFGAVFYDENGEYRNFRANTDCAAGTGGFLEQQAGRLRLKDIAELCRIAGENHGEAPRIATRCAVFAKTDLIHAQQEGYDLAAICDGLCRGLARNIVNTLFSVFAPLAPIVLIGGVSRNAVVAGHLRRITGKQVITDEMGSLYGAAGAAWLLMEEDGKRARPARVEAILKGKKSEDAEGDRHHPPLNLNLSDYPDFNGIAAWECAGKTQAHPVEVDLYAPLPQGPAVPVYLGIDIGSTSTKAAVTDADNRMLAGFYTRTAGRPVTALQSILAAMADAGERSGAGFRVMAAGVTGSGRKLIGKIIGADLVIDEITAHARAALELHPGVDTIIEIGGQDSKFTTLSDGRVDFCVMNTVCAAGTGSFIEEQAERLGCPLSEYADRATGCKAPLASDRCTVFMERDLNHYLNRGCATGEALAAALHAVRENYLCKVAVEGRIGRHVVFQGATARNRALVAAFEQRLERPIHVSRYCHLAGALGVALSLADAGEEKDAFRTTFKGLRLHERGIPVFSEMCDICPNHCKLTVAEIEGERVAYGFLCGREYDERRRVDNNRSGFDLIRARKRAFPVPKAPGVHPAVHPTIHPATDGATHSNGHPTGHPAVHPNADGAAPAMDNGKPSLIDGQPPRWINDGAVRRPVIGLPATLHLVGELPMWRTFFHQLGFQTVTSRDAADAIEKGRRVSGAEFCAPMTALFGHARTLLEDSRADAVFLPFSMERRVDDKRCRRQNCYYTQYAPALVKSAFPDAEDRLMTPLIDSLYYGFHDKTQLYRALKLIPGGYSPFLKVSAAFDAARRAADAAAERMRRIYAEETADGQTHAVLLGRPYTILSAGLNKNIPGILAGLGVKTFFQDMVIPPEAADPDTADPELSPLLREIHWRWAAQILAAARKVAETPGAYPVLVTSFKCSPDAFAIDYFRDIMAAFDKPYLLLQLDEHGSSVGYETRIEAAVRAFYNHRRKAAPARPEPRKPCVRMPRRTDRLTDKTLYFPDWDPIALPLVMAGLRREGVDARMIRPSPGAVRESLRRNTGQCIPLNIMARAFTDSVRRDGVDPGRAAMWMIESRIPCNLGIYPHHMGRLIAEGGDGMDRAAVYVGTINFAEISLRLPGDVFLAYLCGGMVRAMGCRVRPYEATPGAADAAMTQALSDFETAFLENRPLEPAAEDAVARFEAIALKDVPRRPRVALFGDLYVRDNPMMNQDIIRAIETAGGEAVTTSYSDLVRMISGSYMRKWFHEGNYMSVLSSTAFLTAIRRRERRLLEIFGRITGDGWRMRDAPADRILSAYHLNGAHTGESMENLIKIHHLKARHPDIRLFVQLSPAYCCPALVTEAMARSIERLTGTPIVSITYDGVGGDKNSAIAPYLAFPANRRLPSARSGSGQTGLGRTGLGRTG